MEMRLCGLFFLVFFHFVESTRLIRIVRRTEGENLERLRKWRLMQYMKIRRSVETENNRNILMRRDKLQPNLDASIPFLCPLNNSRSNHKPTSVHKLRPGDIDVVASIGDSLSVGIGLTATNLFQLYFPNRDIAPAAGGRSTWRQYLTIPNILKVFNPNLVGYATESALSIQVESQFNVAELGAMSADIPHMAKILVKRMESHRGVDLANDWKLVTIMIGPNNFCADICYKEHLEDVIEMHKNDLLQTLRTLRDNLPRVFVNLIPAPNLKLLIDFVNRPRKCHINHLFVCPCLYGEPFKKNRHKYVNIMTKWQEVEIEISRMPEFDTENFTVVVQPFTTKLVFPTKSNDVTDYSFLSEDCFHFSQKGSAMIANSIWNNMLEPVGQKSTRETRLFAKFNCPSEVYPYIFTNRNSKRICDNCSSPVY